MKIVIDDKIPYIKGALEPFAEVIYVAGAKTSPELVKDADALVTRTRTICNANLLEGSKVKFIATATIGFDHIDTAYCHENGIQWKNAPGCNAESVNQYMASALFSVANRKNFKLRDKTIGIVGVGQVGSRVERLCRTIGMKVLLNDPPRERLEGPGKFVNLDRIKQDSDIISFHVPLNMEGLDRTFHMADEEFLMDLGKKAILVNTCRGEVFHSSAVLDAVKSERISGLIIDCWENEPAINLELLNLVDIGTSHIAGYSKDGKANGTKASVRAISRFFNLGIDTWEPQHVDPPPCPFIEIDGSGKSEQAIHAEAVLATYQVEKDHKALKSMPENFEKLRGDYPVRREFASHTVLPYNVTGNTLDKLKNLGFNLVDR